ncbi:hypothetical protein TCAL_12291 [Tigriopus californicus]|uniref:ribose-5-phosphate isomerase n=1 Tax=Tigriopus californicus TaxID=6832 RepID=A0A553NCQ8_TIGCA|nr:hypothetical protein TCAL_12291 [Tigriopus californicus]
MGLGLGARLARLAHLARLARLARRVRPHCPRARRHPSVGSVLVYHHTSGVQLPVTLPVTFHTRSGWTEFTPRFYGQPSTLSRIMSSGTAQPLSPVEAAKRDAAYAAIDRHVRPDMQMVGIGSGSTIVYGVQRIAAKTQAGDLGPHIKYVPTSFQAKKLITQHGLPLGSLDEGLRLDVTIDGCDEADEELTLIKGGGGCLAQEKVVAHFSREFVVIADYRKRSPRLGTAWAYVPIEVLPLAYVPERLGGSAVLRMAQAKAGPVVTDNSNFILDWHFRDSKVFEGGPETTDRVKWSLVNQQLLAIPGLVETGIFINMARQAYFGQADGSVQELAAKPV